MTLDELQAKHNRTMAMRAKQGKAMAQNHPLIFIKEPISAIERGNNRASKNKGKRKLLTIGHQLKIGRV